MGEWAELIGGSISGEIIAILAVGGALAGVILTATRGLRQDIRQDMARLESRLDERINGLETGLDERISGLESRFDGLERQFGELRERMAHLEGLPGRIARGHHRAGHRQLDSSIRSNLLSGYGE